MRTLHLGLRVADRERSLEFYAAVGYEVVGSVPGTALGHLTMLKLPEDEFVTIELVSPPDGGQAHGNSTLSHIVVKTDSLSDTVATLATKGIAVDGPETPRDSGDLQTAWITDPDGNRIELVQWPPGHPDGMTATDWPD